MDLQFSKAAMSIQSVLREFQDFGNTAYDVLSDEDNTSVQKEQYFHFEQATILKDFFILWRNVLFEIHKAILLKEEGKTDDEAILRLFEASKNTLFSAKAELYDRLKEPDFETKKSQKLQEKWEKQTNPWPIIRKQFDSLYDQINSLGDEQTTLSKNIQQFQQIRSLIGNNSQQSEDQIQRIEGHTEECIQFIKDHIEESPGKVAVHLRDVEQKAFLDSNNALFTTKLEEFQEDLLSKGSFAIHTKQGLLVQKDIDFQQKTKAWVESEVLPLLYEMWELTSNVSNGFRMALANVGNRAAILANDKKEGKASSIDGQTLTQPLRAFFLQEKVWEKEMKEIVQNLNQRLDKDFWVTDIFSKKTHFLPIPYQTTIEQIDIEQNEWFERIKSWFLLKIKALRDFQETLKKEEALSVSELALRFIQSRSMNPDNHHYASIFLTKGYIGESFWVGRKLELERMEGLIDSWENGYRSSVLISGKRLSGKSLFGELVATRYFMNKVIRVQPNSVIKVNGRKLFTNTNLGEALDFVQKHSTNQQTVVWIDDLELWADADLEISLGKNVRHLCKHLNQNANRIFFMVSMGNWLKDHLSKIFDLDLAFQAEINLDKMSKSETLEAIRIRHGATHKVLISKDLKKERMDKRELQKVATRVYDMSEGNVGEALNLWAASIHKVDENRVEHKELPSYLLPEGLSPDSAVLLSTLMIEKRSNEYRLRKLFGPAFSEKYSIILQRFVGMGLLIRQIDGSLEINEHVVNEVGRLLEERKYLKFS